MLNIIQRIHHQDNSHNSMSSLFSLTQSTSIDEEFNLFYSFQDRLDKSFYFYISISILLRIRCPESLLSYWINLGIEEGSEVLHDLGLRNQQANYHFETLFFIVEDFFIKGMESQRSFGASS